RVAWKFPFAAAAGAAPPTIRSGVSESRPCACPKQALDVFPGAPKRRRMSGLPAPSGVIMSLLQALHLPPIPQQAPQEAPGSSLVNAVSSQGPGFGNNPHPVSPRKDDKSTDDEWVPGNLVKTPYGRVHRYVDKTVPNAEAFNKFAFNAVEDEITAREDGASLDKAMSGEKPVSAFVAKHLNSFEAEVMANRSGNAKAIARDMEQQKQLIGAMTTSFQQLQLTLEQAKGHL